VCACTRAVECYVQYSQGLSGIVLRAFSLVFVTDMQVCGGVTGHVCLVLCAVDVCWLNSFFQWQSSGFADLVEVVFGGHDG